jgi:HSP20 family protein
MKTMTLYRPTAIQNALSELDCYFESFLGDSILPPAARVFNHLPAVDVRETEKSYVLEMELPGYDEKGIEIHIDGSNLSVASKQEEAPGMKDDGESKGAWLIRERRVNSFSRSFKLPENANPETVSAEFKNGILSLDIVKRAEAQKRAIQINVK